MFNPAYQHMPGISPRGSNESSGESPCSPSEASQAAEILFGCYRTGGAAEPEIFVAGVAAVLSEYPHQVVLRVVDPRYGLPSRTNWLPTIAEVKAACEKEIAPLRRQWDREKRERETAGLLSAPKGERPSIEQIKEKLGPRYGIDGENPRKPYPRNKTEDELRQYATTEIEISPTLAESNREYMQKFEGEE